MIKTKFLFPEYYIQKIPMCDECNIELKRTGTAYMTDPVQLQYACPQCNKEYLYREEEVCGQWKLREL